MSNMTTEEMVALIVGSEDIDVCEGEPIIARLREADNHEKQIEILDQMNDANCDEIDRLASENKRLREQVETLMACRDHWKKSYETVKRIDDICINEWEERWERLKKWPTKSGTCQEIELMDRLSRFIDNLESDPQVEEGGVTWK